MSALFGRDVVFVGPSLTRVEAEASRPGVRVLPPAGLGDVMSVVRDLAPRAVVLIDGVFHSRMSVFHKELLFALDRGTWVLGAASIGALRAAECEQFGVIGVGDIFRMFSSGELVDDDEVALAHGDEASGYVHLSDAMVTVRAAIEGLVADGLVSDSERDSLLARQKNRWFPERHTSHIARDLFELGADPGRIDAVRRSLAGGYRDPKRDDARAALLALNELPSGPFPEEWRPHTSMTSVFRAALVRETRVLDGDQFSVRTDDIRRRAALHDADYSDIVRTARTKLALRALSLWLAGPVNPTEIASARVSVARRLGTTIECLAERARDLDMDEFALSQLVEREAHVTRMERSWFGSSAHGAITGPVLDEMRLAGLYCNHRDHARLEHELTTDFEFEPPLTSAEVVGAFASLTGTEPVRDLASMAETLELGSAAEMLESMLVTVKAGSMLFGLAPARVQARERIEDDPLMSRGR